MLTNQRVLKIHADEDAKMEKHKQQTKQQQQKSSLKYKLEVDNCKEKKRGQARLELLHLCNIDSG